MANEKLDTSQKARQINLDANRYGTFAEIGAGQEVVRWFFRAGGEIQILLVTNDNALAGEARRLGSRTLSALEFGAFL